MRRRELFTMALAAAQLAACTSLRTSMALPEPLPEAENLAIIAQMRPLKRARPLAAVLLDNQGSETSDSIVPWSVLKRSGVADLRMFAMQPGPMMLMPILSVGSEQTIDSFDDAYPKGAD